MRKKKVADDKIETLKTERAIYKKYRLEKEKGKVTTETILVELNQKINTRKKTIGFTSKKLSGYRLLSKHTSPETQNFSTRLNKDT